MGIVAVLALGIVIGLLLGAIISMNSLVRSILSITFNEEFSPEERAIVIREAIRSYFG